MKTDAERLEHLLRMLNANTKRTLIVAQVGEWLREARAESAEITRAYMAGQEG